ncbi:unnamed protein product [Rangifer tarandus platyrhynchus]|uniref:Uncharacterized protein n=1 Tax=Rangifer tarandus platyrhynchus TaxID=3082113 RepID=A0ABN9A0D5_RANTA|nr:unnamed protein product [Rangifer tarandus platyrhynchus]
MSPTEWWGQCYYVVYLRTENAAQFRQIIGKSPLQPLPPEDQKCSPLRTVSLPLDWPRHSGALTLALQQALTALGSFLALALSLRCTEASFSTGRQTFDLSEQKYVNLSEKQSKSTISQETEKILT